MKSALLFLAVGTTVGQGLQGCYCNDDVIWHYPLLELAEADCCLEVLGIPNLANCLVESSKIKQFASCCSKYNDAHAVCE